MGQAYVPITPAILSDILTEGHAFHVLDGISAGAKYIRSWLDEQHDTFNVVFEHPDWPEVRVGERIPQAACATLRSLATPEPPASSLVQ